MVGRNLLYGSSGRHLCLSGKAAANLSGRGKGICPVEGDALSLRAAVVRASVYLAVPLAILTSVIVSVLLQDIAPAGQGPAYALFPYGGETVGIALTGGVLPVLMSLLLVAVLRRRPRREAGPLPFRSRP